jgi:hypothetical protein
MSIGIIHVFKRRFSRATKMFSFPTTAKSSLLQPVKTEGQNLCRRLANCGASGGKTLSQEKYFFNLQERNFAERISRLSKNFLERF